MGPMRQKKKKKKQRKKKQNVGHVKINDYKLFAEIRVRETSNWNWFEATQFHQYQLNALPW